MPARGKTTPASTPGSYRPATGERSRVAVAVHDGQIEPDMELANDVQDFFEANGRIKHPDDGGDDIRSSELRHLATLPGVPAVLADVLNDPRMDEALYAEIDDHIGIRFATAVAVINHYQPVARVGVGGERIVFDLGDGHVLKVSLFGGGQSQQEHDAGTRGDTRFASVRPVPASVPQYGTTGRTTAVATIQEQLVEMYITNEDAIAEDPTLASCTDGYSQIGRRADGSLCVYDIS